LNHVIEGLEPGDREQLDDVVKHIGAVFDRDVIGIYLFGSAVHGGLRSSSDLDVLVVLDRPTTTDARRRLIVGLLERSRAAERPMLRHLEVTAIVAPHVTPWRYPPPMELQYGDWWRQEFRAGEEPWRSPNPDLAVILTSVRDESVALIGPAAAQVLDPVPLADLERACRDVIPELLPGIEAKDDTRNSLLTLARIWFTLSTGRIESKDVAAAWALERLPDGTGEALRLARAGYLGQVADRWDAPQIALAKADWSAMTTAIRPGTRSGERLEPGDRDDSVGL
jgi:predicted nucleotidyltransferase